jgi:N-glycosylase/DNA lyase
MTPKIYEAVGKRLGEIWGAYAGWAQSVFFTSDLKSFESYGLPTPAPTPVKKRIKEEVEMELKLDDVREVLETPTRLRPRKRKVYEDSLSSPTKPKRARVESSFDSRLED